MQLKASLRGHDFATQVQMLSPEHGAIPGATAIHQAAAKGIQGSGSRLPHGDKIQRSFGGFDLSNVQTHAGAHANAAAAAMGADAYATGNHVVLGQGGQDLHTVAHEAAHVVQQRHGVSLSGAVGTAGDPYEQHADAVADRVVQGKSAEGLLGQMAGGASNLETHREGSPVQMRATPLLESPSVGIGATRSASSGGRVGAENGYAYSNPELAERVAQGQWGAVWYSDRVATQHVKSALPQPLPEYVGYPEYYLARHRDFLRRHRESQKTTESGVLGVGATLNAAISPPDYYLSYGYKYAQRFTNELFPRLSDRGKGWLVRARVNLQLAIENTLMSAPRLFETVEKMPDRFRDFCFGTHAKAYLDAGLADLPMSDLTMIATTPDISDLFSAAGLEQVFDVVLGLTAHTVGNVFDVVGGAANIVASHRSEAHPVESDK
jgi:hypothetical protein